jgi:hypothetical protein
LPALAEIIRLESGCLPTALGDKTVGGSYGLLQIHCPTWGLPNRYNEIGWLQARGIIETCEDLFEPITNLVAGLLIWREAKGFGVWSTYAGWAVRSGFIKFGGFCHVLVEPVTPEETAETLEGLAERLINANIAFAMSEAAYHLIRQQRIIEELRAEISSLLTMVKYDWANV